MIVIKFSVYNQRLRRITSGIIPSNAYGKIKFEFDFRTDDWDVVETKTANFYYKGENYPRKLDKNNQCYVPEEVIYTPSFIVSVHGGNIFTNSIKNFVESENTTIKPGDNINPNGFEILDGGEITASSIKEPIEEDESNSNDNNSSTANIVFVPSINEDKILSWIISESGADVKVPDPVDLNPFDEWSTDGDVVSEYEWEEE